MSLFNKKKEMDPYANTPAFPEMNDPFQQQPGADPYGQGYYPSQEQPPVNPSPQQFQPQDNFQQQGLSPTFPAPTDDGRERIEEVAEAIIDEKWNELVKEMNKVIEWKEHTDTEINKMGQEIENLKERFESLHKGVLGKISEYDQNLTNVGTEIKAMDKVFQNILPTFTENMNRLERISKKFDKK